MEGGEGGGGGGGDVSNAGACSWKAGDFPLKAQEMR